MKLIILFLSLLSALSALTINDSLLKVHATLVPKIYLMDYQFEDKLQNNAIAIAIMYERKEYKEAKRLKSMMESKYKDGIKGYRVAPKLVEYKDVDKTQANIYYLFPTQSQKIKKVVARADLNNALTFAYNRDDLKHGVMISLNVSKKIKPLLNLEAIKMRKITLRPVLIKISTIYTKTSSLNIEEINLRGFNFYKVYQA